MTQEDKNLFLKDIFGRIPYGVKCSYLDIEFNDTTYGNLESFDYDEDKDVIFVIDGIGIYSEHVKPYLFPMSSMTDEQKTEWDYIDYYADHHEAVDWLNKNHFDYRGLIDMGLALDATNKNIY